MAQLAEVPIVLHEGLTEDDKVRLADEDNENDEYHEKVNPVDTWANYAWLKEQGWTQERIAKAKVVSRVMVSYRLSLHELPDKIKKFVSQNILTEGHLTEIQKMSVDLHFSPWLTTEQVRLELARLAADQYLTVRDTRKIVLKFKALIAMAAELCQKTNQPKDFIALLSKTKARSMVQVQEAYNQVKEAELKEAKERELALIERRDKAEAERIKLEQDAEKNRVIQEILDKIILGDFSDIGPTLRRGS